MHPNSCQYPIINYLTNTNNAVGNQTGSQPANRGGSGGQGGRGVATTLAEEMMIDTEAAVMANFDFLSSEVEVDDDEVRALIQAESSDILRRPQNF